MSIRCSPFEGVRLFALLSSLCLLSCDVRDSTRVRHELKAEGWHRQGVLEFFFVIEDPQSPYQIYAEVQSTPDYPYHNLYLVLTLKEALHCQTLATQRKALLLYHPAEGYPLGSEAEGYVQHRAIFLADYAFKHAGTYLLSVRHDMREEILMGLTSVGGVVVKGRK